MRALTPALVQRAIRGGAGRTAARRTSTTRLAVACSSEVCVSVFLPKGTRDFLPEEMNRRLAVIETIRGVFHRFGFEPLETPAIERIETLTGKYGDETDKLMFRIHKRGRDAQPGECDLALRYDLTVPLARVLAMHGELRMPFKRYQIQPVWRAERPQKGRFREFYQCDVDIAGSTSPMADAECVAVADAAVRELGFTAYTIAINDRRILGCFARRAGATDMAGELAVLIALDKLDKIGKERVEDEIRGRGFDPDGLAALWVAVEGASGSRDGLLNALEADLDEQGQAGVATLRQVIDLAMSMGVPSDRIRFDPSLARGADYYTGPVFEIAVDEPKIGSVAGGGRYDGLVGSLSGREVPAVGVSLGLERLLVVMEELNMLDEHPTSADVLVTVFSDEGRWDAAKAAAELRALGVSAELYVGDARLKSQLKHANKRGYPWVAIVGPDEAAAGVIMLRSRKNWDGDAVPVDEAARRIRASAASVDPDPSTR